VPHILCPPLVLDLFRQKNYQKYHPRICLELAKISSYSFHRHHHGPLPFPHPCMTKSICAPYRHHLIFLSFRFFFNFLLLFYHRGYGQDGIA
jgi:hypothetical protein